MSTVLRHLPANGVKALPNVKNIIAVGSGKGGVGKSTVAINLAMALQAQGAVTGVLDADIYGPSVPLLLGVEDQTANNHNQKLDPIIAYGLQIMSLGFLVKENAPAVWRGPMASSALQQMLTATNWNNLDYLIIDLPPGTGDVQLTLAQKIPVCGAVVVTTPQDVALLDVSKALAMFKKVNIPVFGIVENMGVHVCSNCGHNDPIFGTNGGANLASQHDLKLLGSLPLLAEICHTSDQGKPVFLQNDKIANIFKEIAAQVTAALAQTPRDFAIPTSNMIVTEC